MKKEKKEKQVFFHAGSLNVGDERRNREGERKKNRRKKKEGNERKKECMRVFCFVLFLI